MYLPLGLILLKIVLPRKKAPELKGIPFLLTHHNSRSVSAECNTSLKNNNLDSLCNHDDKERAFIDCWTIFEINYAITLGYQVLQIYEAMIYFSQEFIYKDYMSFLARSKICHSELPQENLQSYLDEINEGMDFNNDELVKISDLSPDHMAKTQMKGQMNMGLGKFLQNTDGRYFEYCQSNEEINRFYERYDVDVIHCCFITENIVQLTLQKKPEYIRPNRNTHVVNGSLTTAYGRCYLDMGMRYLLKDPNTKILYCDTDSIIYGTSTESSYYFFILKLYLCLRYFKNQTLGTSVAFRNFRKI